MNRPGAVHQSLRGMPTGFGGQQQPQQPGRAVSTRLPNGKMGNNAPGWSFGGGMPMGGAGLPNPNRQMGAGGAGANISFAQSLTGSQPATPIDLSEFPSLSNNSQISSSNPSTMWASGGSRNPSGPIPRGQSTPLSQQNQQDDIFLTSRLAAAQGSFRFGGQGSVGQTSQTAPGSAEEFPPLNSNSTNDIGQDRSSSIMSSLGFGSQASANNATASVQGSRTGNGLLNALSANTRASDVRPSTGPQIQEARAAGAEEDMRRKYGPFRDENISTQRPLNDGAQQPTDAARNPLGAIGNNSSASKEKDDKGQSASQVQDPLEGMPPSDKWGLKGLRTLMNNYPDFNALICGIDPNSLGLDLNSNELISTQIYSPFDDVPPRPAVPNFRLPECYKVDNVQPIDNKIGNFNEETLMWIFYSSPGDIKQQLAAIELHNRNWRWHKKHQLWLTKDELMIPQVLSPTHERGYYIIWDTSSWRKERREFTLYYAELDSNPGSAA